MGALVVRVPVTGAGGFIGRHVVEELCGLGHPMRATDLPRCSPVAAEEAGAEACPADLLTEVRFPFTAA